MSLLLTCREKEEFKRLYIICIYYTQFICQRANVEFWGSPRLPLHFPFGNKERFSKVFQRTDCSKLYYVVADNFVVSVKLVPYCTMCDGSIVKCFIASLA